MSELSPYCSELFKNKIFPAFSLKNLKKLSSAESYINSINLVCNYCKKDFLSLEHAELQEFFDLLRTGQIKTKYGKPFTYNSVFQRFSSLRSLSSFIQVNAELFGISYSSPFLLVELNEPSSDISIDRILTENSIDTLLSTASSDTQMYLILSLVLLCGLTTSEILTLKADQLVIDAEGRLAVVFKKRNGETRFLKVPDSIKDQLLRFAEPAAGNNLHVFTNIFGRPLSMRMLSYRVKEVMEKAGLPGWTLSDLRNTASVYMRAGGASVSQTARQLGISERWIFRYKRAVEEMNVQAGDYNMIRIKETGKNNGQTAD